jgi:nicotinamidase-related amidase
MRHPEPRDQHRWPLTNPIFRDRHSLSSTCRTISFSGFAHLAREHPEAKIDLPFLMGTLPQVTRLAEAFRKAGRPVVYIAHVLKPDYSDAQFPYWRVTRGSLSHNRTFITEGTWGAQVIDELKPMKASILSSRRVSVVSRTLRWI